MCNLQPTVWGRGLRTRICEALKGLSEPPRLARLPDNGDIRRQGKTNVRKIVAGLFISLDGVVESPDQWGFQYMDSELGNRIAEGIAQADAVLLGPATYRLFAQIWPQQADNVPMASFLNRSTKYVMSSAPEAVGSLEWQPARLLRGDLVSALTELRARPGRNIQVPGSPKLVRSLLRENLLDELSLMICPVVVGVGARLFDGPADRVNLKLEHSRISDNGAIAVTYRPLPSGGQATQPLHFPEAAGRH